ncbi:PIR protein [Plasmodium reichenowi]|uniref:PIR protein n=1 Tax=Plasmodium reichenowi TaxID=5854 RepID=A0A2P9DT37_PLARE|nr:PIR protein [Plasmodium reichenowi]
MKVHYINILLFALPLNILLYNQRNHKSTTTHHTQTIRLLCECDLYMPNYDNDLEMKKVMDNFNKQTQQRFHEYDERLQSKRIQCKDKCNKEIQKIILKDKLEKQMAEQLTTLETKIDTNDIPTCVCENSIADKTEKFCLNCGMNVGGGVTLSSGVLGGISEALIIAWKPAAITAAKEAAEKAATAAATQAGIDAVVSKLKGLHVVFSHPSEGFVDLSSIVNKLTYKNGTLLVERAKKVIGDACWNESRSAYTSFYNTTIHTGSGDLYIGKFGKIGSDAYDAAFTSKKVLLEADKVGAVNTGFESSITSIYAPIIAIVIIVLIMVIIYLILRYRRKKKMKKKLQYIKLLEE